ncbi:MAG: RHS repeat protein [Nitrospirae bacterium]|nr:RHS repeat protein [Nitrospirota bacterium]
MFWGRNYFRVFIVSIFFLLVLFNISGAERVDYIYDSTGRLSKAVTSGGDVRQFRYDKAGNLLGIDSFIVSTASPLIHSISPEFVFPGQSPFTLWDTDTEHNFSVQAGIEIFTVFVSVYTVVMLLDLDLSRMGISSGMQVTQEQLMAKLNFRR